MENNSNIWKLKEKAPEEFLKNPPADLLNAPPAISQMLWNRGLKTEKDIFGFFAAKYEEGIHDPFLFKGMKPAVERILKAVENKEKIIVYGDYDADGMCGSAVLHSVFSFLGANFAVYIPDRFSSGGYGLTFNSLNEIISSENPDLIITVDCGIADSEEIKFLAEKGIDAIVLDHHLPPLGDLPPAVAIVDAKLEDGGYPYKFLCGAGVAFKAAQAILKKQKVIEMPEKKRESFEKWLLDLVAAATVADMVPLFDENRLFVKYGLKVFAKTKRIGLIKLMEEAGLKKSANPENPGEFEIKESDLGFLIGPRLNASSRMGRAANSFELLITESEEEAKWLAQKLSETNRARQDATGKIVKEIMETLSGKDLPKVVVDGRADWPAGVIGIAAAKIMEKFHRPVFLFREEDGILRGSCRGIPNFNVVEAMRKCGDIFEEMGGHAVAAGFRLKRENLEKFKNGLLAVAEKELKEEDLIPAVDVEAAVPLAEINWEFYRNLQKFRPFGQENPVPVFLAEKTAVVDFRLVGNGEKHLKLKLGADGKIFPAIGFNFGTFASGLKIGDLVDVLFELEENIWNGRKELQLKIIDIKRA